MREPDNPAADSAAAVKCDLACEVLRSFGSLRFSATGWSMLPTIWPGDTLVVERVAQSRNKDNNKDNNKDQVRVGDVVLVGRAGRLCAHRIVSTTRGPENSQWITQGDGMAAPDSPVTGNELLGRVAYLIRAGKLMAVPATLTVVERLLARVVRRSVPAARALVHLHHMRRSSGQPGIFYQDQPYHDQPYQNRPCQH
jgi:hypothetical protein